MNHIFLSLIVIYFGVGLAFAVAGFYHGCKYERYDFMQLFGEKTLLRRLAGLLLMLFCVISIMIAWPIIVLETYNKGGKL